jgi:hypothetical protein
MDDAILEVSTLQLIIANEALLLGVHRADGRATVDWVRRGRDGSDRPICDPEGVCRSLKGVKGAAGRGGPGVRPVLVCVPRHRPHAAGSIRRVMLDAVNLTSFRFRWQSIRGR